MGIVDASRDRRERLVRRRAADGWLVGHASFWRAAVAGAGVYDWWEQAVLADINEQFAIDFLGGASPWTKDGRAAFAAESPITYAANIRTPLLILSDTGDQRVPIAQSYALYHALHDRGAHGDVRRVSARRPLPGRSRSAAKPRNDSGPAGSTGG